MFELTRFTNFDEKIGENASYRKLLQNTFTHQQEAFGGRMSYMLGTLLRDRRKTGS